MSKQLSSILIGSGVVTSLLLACIPPTPSKQNQGSGGSGGNMSSTGGGVGSGGSNGSGGAATGGSSSSGGSTGSGGDSSPDAAVSTGGAGGTASGTGGIPPMPEPIDDLEDSNDRILMANGRQGPWHQFNDGGTQTTPSSSTFMTDAGGANSTMRAVHTKGNGQQNFAGVGFDLNNATTVSESPQSQAYDASAFTGISFWAKGTGNIRVEIPQKSFVPTDRGGSCASNCWNVYGSTMPMKMLTTEWKQFTIPFSSLTRDTGASTPAFDPAALMGISFKHAGKDAYDFWIDEVHFTRGGSVPTGSGGRGGGNGAGGITGSGGATSGSGGATGSGGGMVVEPPRLTSGSNAWASRYWDCCKPACGWKGNVGGRTPAVSCNQQNMSLGGNYDAKNACESGGTAYMCWNGAPWSVSDTLSYGFAAASGPNYNCGRCFQIQFTGSGHNGNNAGVQALSNKTMIIQVLNNGGVAQDQFDLLIPGGGVGLLNACATQWGMSDLGAQYGGFLTGCKGDKNCVKQKCMTVFNGKPELQAGCDWFLGWFNAADNPNLIYKQIACPQAITQRSGLSDPG